MSIYDTGRSNLTRLTANLGAKQALAMKLDMTPPQVSHWLREPHRTGARKISEDSAREIERVLGLPPGDLDHDPDAPRTDPKDIDPKLMADVIRAVFAAAQRANMTDAAKLADITMLTYSHSRLTGTVDGAMLASLLALAG